ncbi:MAG: MFS transporter [Anaerolineae bacterium]|nr:MFS transporter [Anaerolineae bacterium]
MPTEAPSSDEDTNLKSTQDGLSFSMTILYSLGSAAGLFLYNTFNAFVQFFYADVVGLPAQWVGRGLFAFGFWNALNDPLVGWIADNKKSATGRRTWFIRTLAIPVAIAFMAIWLPPFNIAEHGMRTVMVYFLIIISIYDVLQSLITLSVDALLPEMFQEPHARLRGTMIVTVIGSVLGGLAIALAPTVYSKWGWGALAVIWGVFAACLYFASLLGIRENPKYAEAEEAPILERLNIVFRNRTFLIVIALNLTFRIMLAVLVTSMPFYTKYVLQVDETKTAQLVIVFVIAYTSAIILWQPVYRRFGTRNTLLISTILFGGASLPTIFASTLLGAMGVVALIGFGLSGPSLLGIQLVFADTVDEDYVNTGVRREGLYRGILGFVYRWPPAFSALFMGELLDWSGYNEALDPSSQPVQVAISIRYFIGLTPFFVSLITALLVYWYPLYGERLKNIRFGVQQRNNELENPTTL